MAIEQSSDAMRESSPLRPLPSSCLFVLLDAVIFDPWTLQGWAKEWALGCVYPASWLPLAAGGEFTQPRAHSFAQPCMYFTYHLLVIAVPALSSPFARMRYAVGSNNLTVKRARTKWQVHATMLFHYYYTPLNTKNWRLQ